MESINSFVTKVNLSLLLCIPLSLSLLIREMKKISFTLATKKKKKKKKAVHDPLGVLVAHEPHGQRDQGPL
jgi:hypothetical protein